MTTEEFIAKAKAVHGDKYDYSKVEYVNSQTKVCVICQEHGEWAVTPKEHLRGRGCPNCYTSKKFSYEECYETALQFTSRADFMRSYLQMYEFANRRGWVNQYSWFQKLWEKKWNRESCYQEAKKFQSRGAFKKNSPSAYKKARENKWLDDYTWFLVPRKHVPHGYWNLETCFEEAKKYKTKVEFEKGNNGAYQAAIKNKWMIYFTWLEPSFKWTLDACVLEAKNYDSLSDFRKAKPNAYNYAVKHNLIQSLSWLKLKRKPNGYWTYQICSQEAKKYKTKAEFKKNNPQAHAAAERNDWLDDWFNNEHFNILGKVDCVYCYLFEEHKTIYVGRTLMRRKTSRDREHLYIGERDAVYKFAKKMKCAIPPMTILEENLTITEGQEREEYWRQKYANDGYSILNKAATGIGKGSLGSLDNGKWNKTACYLEAKKYSYLRDFETYSASACMAARRNGWLKEYDWLTQLWQPRWNKEECEKEARKYSTRKAFQKGSKGAYKKALEKGWIDGYTWMPIRNSVPHKYWDNYQNCYNEAKKYKTRSEFQHGCQGAYDKARINNWLRDYTWFVETQKRKGYWNRETCFEEAKKWKNATSFAKNAERAYYLAKTNDWMKDYVWFEKQFVWTYDLCRKEALKCIKRSEFKNKYRSAYTKARKNGWLDDFFPKKKK